MNEFDINNLVTKQRKFFQTGKTLSLNFRIQALQTLHASIQLHEDDLYQALYKDLGKSPSESYMCEIGLVYSELHYMLKHIKIFSKEKKVRTPISQAISKSYIKPTPKGNVLIMSPWNYPFLLTMDPLIDAIAAGNTVILKPSAYAPYTAKVIECIIKETFPQEYVGIVMGGRKENQSLLSQKFNHIFFTGSQAVGKEVLKKAAENLTPVTLELGGKSPCIVDKTANIKLAAKRIVFGKFLNCGQTCVAPDYIYCDQSIINEFIEALIKEIQKQFSSQPLQNKLYGKIINEKHYNRLCNLLNENPILYGGKTETSTLKIEPTILYPCTWDHTIMKEEIFGPLLPILTYSSIDEVIPSINNHPTPLALYIFSNNKKIIDTITSACPYGGGCINDTVIHLATPYMGFGGFQESGMGSYHGKTGFDTFTHYKSIIDKKTWFDLPMRYQPYSKFRDTFIKFFLR